MTTPNSAPAPGTLWRHYKGGLYLAEGVGRHSETEGWHVIYRSLKAPQTLWLRPLEMWHETVVTTEGSVPRFQAISSDD